MYFLDFDRTTFDTDSFTPYLRERFVGTDVADLSNAEFGAHMDRLVREGSLSFTPGELSPFLYEDAARFLRDKENGVMLLTFGNPAFQKVKIESALYGIPRITTHYTGDVRKGDFIAPHIGMYGHSPTFIDDSVIELEILSARCPGARIIEMRRGGEEGEGRWSVIRTLSELP